MQRSLVLEMVIQAVMNLINVLTEAWQRSLFNGKCQVIVQAGTKAGIIKFEAKAAGLWTGSTDIITIDPEKANAYTIDKKYELKGEAAKPRPVDKMIGADISFLPQLEERGIKFSDKGVAKDAIEILKRSWI